MRNIAGKDGSGGTREIYGTLRREGIKPISSNSSTSSVKLNKNDVMSALSNRYQILNNGSWIEIGDGWQQITPSSSGSITRCGLHSVVQSGINTYYACLYIPRNPAAYNVAVGENPCYDLQVQLKHIPPENVNTRTASSSNFGSEQIHVIFSYQHPQHYYILVCDFTQKLWSVVYYQGDSSTVLHSSHDPTMKSHHFYTILIQIRGMKLSIDINSQPLFTAVKVMHDLSGLMGLASNNAKYAIKGWKLKGLPQKPLGTVGMPHHNPALLDATKQKVSIIMSQEESFLPSEPERPLITDTDDASSYHTNTLSAPYQPGHTGMPSTSTGTNRQSSRSLHDVLQQQQQQQQQQGYAQPVNVPSSSSSSSSVSYSFQPPKLPHANYHTAYPPNPPPLPSYTNTNTNMNTIPQNPFAKYMQAPTAAANTQQIPPTNTNTNHNNHNPGYNSRASPPTTLPTTNNINISSGSSSSLLTASQYAEIVQQNDPQIVETVLRELVPVDSPITFQDIAALEHAKKLLYESIVLPTLLPQFFTGIRQAWKGILLFGPPGTGKTMLAKAVCNMKKAKFFNCSASFLVSKYRGDSEKIIRCLFQVARAAAPAVVFMDEIDAIASSRMDGQEHEASRRFKTELFSQMDGLNSIHDHNIVLLAATNCPWDLDPAMRRRLEKRIYIPLPNYDARVALLEMLLKDITVESDVSIAQLAEMSDGYSGSDLHVACRDAAMMPMRRLLETFPPEILMAMQQNGNLELPDLTMEDFSTAFTNTRPSVSAQSLTKYVSWEEEFSNK